MNTNATGRPGVHGPFLTFVFGPFLALEVFWSKNCKKRNGGPFFGPRRLNFHPFGLKFCMRVAKINVYPSYFLDKCQICAGNGQKRQKTERRATPEN